MHSVMSQYSERALGSDEFFRGFEEAAGCAGKETLGSRAQADKIKYGVPRTAGHFDKPTSRMLHLIR